MQPDPRRAPVYVGSEIYRGSSYGPKHPLAIPRVSTCTDLCRAMGWLPDERYIEAPLASDAALARFHDPEYVAALKRAEASQSVTEAERARFRLGAEGNPVYREMFRRPAISAGGVMLSARLTRDGGVVHCPGGGTHHGDGVQDAFHDDPRVFTISVHEAGRWPFTGLAADRAGGAARNFPVPAGFNDTELAWLLRHAIEPLIRRFAPQAIMLQCGADALEEDPLAKLALSNNAYWSVVRAVRGLAPRLVVLGGGGYNPWSVGRCWAGIWATLNDLPIPDRLPAPAEAVLRGLRFDRAAGRNPPESWFTTLRDPPRPGPVRPEIRALAELSLKEILPA